jgi:Fe-S-cluster-containing hydrogenase component 2
MPVEVCIICDRIAEHNIRRGAARVISVDEALAIHDAATDAGLVCLPQSNEPVPKMICHCHLSCCGTLTPAVMAGYPLEKLVAASCYRPETDAVRCTGCGECLNVCQFGALIAGQDGIILTDAEKCLGCGLCVTACPEGARTMVRVKSGRTVPREGAGPLSYTAEQEYAAGKHVETGDVLPRQVKRKK